MSNTFIYEQGWLVEKPEMEKPMDHGQRLTYYQAELSSYQEHISTLRRFKYDYPCAEGAELVLDKNFKVVGKTEYGGHGPDRYEVAIPITQRTYSEQELLDTWDAATNRFFDDQYGKVPTCSPSKSEFFKQKFGIEIK